jgi:hypothetical protein
MRLKEQQYQDIGLCSDSEMGNLLEVLRSTMFFSITVTVMKLEGQGIEVASCFV